MKSLTSTFTQILFPLSLIASTLAHGWLGTLTVASNAHTGPLPVEQIGLSSSSSSPSPIRQILNNLPIKDPRSLDLTCGRGAAPGTQLAAAKPGDVLRLDWKTLAEGGRWFHDVGPMMAYLTECGSASKCTGEGEGGFNASEAEWFKIAQQGVGEDGTWAQAKLDTGAPATLTIPRTLAPGNYLLRFEIIALHTAQSPGGAEFYPACAQLAVSGSGTGKPSASELVKLPGAYKATDKGILVDVYDLPEGGYVFPGPKVAAFVECGSAAASSGAKVASSKTTKAAATAKTTKRASSSKAAASSKTTKAAATHTSRHISTHAASTSAPKSTASPKTCKTSHASRRRRALADAADLEARAEAEAQHADEGVEENEKKNKRSRARHLHRLGGPGSRASF
ncbi:glycoside hydrolase family 61 protein [Mycena polygramma]|nr:glycoside hydrolase family 61 protein [Mycena polygramma]